jgi:hypothetical protein
MNLRRTEPWLVLALALALLVLNAATFRLHPAFGDDDVLLSDAGVNLAMGHGFTSSSWPGQAKEEFFSGNLPLYPLCLGGWLRVFGFGLLQMRLFSYLYGSVALVGIWWALRRREWIVSPGMRLACVGLMFCSAPIVLAVRRNRYDAFQLLLCALLLCVWANAWRPGLKRCALFALGLLIAAGGFQAAAFVGLLCLGAAAWEHWAAPQKQPRSFVDLLAVLAGLAAGGMLMFLIYWRAGVLHGLLENMAWGRSIDATAAGLPRKRLVFDSLTDSAMMPFLLVLLVCAVATRRPQIRRDAAWAAGLTSVIMLALEALVHFASYYRWMTAGLLAILTVRIWAAAAPELTPWARRTGLAGFGACALLGFPALPLGVSLLLPYGRQSARLEEMARAHLRPGDVVFADYQAYCAVKPLCAQAYFPGYLGRMSEQEAASVNVLMVREKHPNYWYIIQYGEYLDRFTRQGRWQRVASAPLERTQLSWFLAHWFPRRVERMEYHSGTWEVNVYRRSDLLD